MKELEKRDLGGCKMRERERERDMQQIQGSRSGEDRCTRKCFLVA